MAVIRRIVSSIIGHLRTTRGKVIAAALIVLLVILEVFSNGSQVNTIPVSHGALVDAVRVVGRIQPSEHVQLAFAAAGRVSSTPVSVSDQVVAGQLLASLETGELGAQFRDAQANVLAQRARLDELLRGTRADEIAIKEAEFNKAIQDLADEYDNVREVLLSSYTYANDAVRVQLDDLFNRIGTNDYPEFDLVFSCASTCVTSEYAAQDLRRQAELGLIVWTERTQNLALNTNEEKLDILSESRSALQDSRLLLDTVDTVLNHPSVGLSDDDVSTYRSDVSAARTSISTALSLVTTQIQSVTSAQLTADRLASELALKKGGARPEQIAAQEAILLSAQAQVDRVGALIGKNLIRTPITGIVTVQDAKVGQTVSIGEPLISVISGQELEIEANVPEVDIGPIVVGNPVHIEIDALPGEVFRGTLVSIEPAETIVDGVVNFQVKVVFEVSDARLKSGLTVNLDIETLRVENALSVPSYVLVTNSDGVFVDVVRGGRVTRVSVQTGVRTMDGMVQVLAGLSEDDEVVVQPD